MIYLTHPKLPKIKKIEPVPDYPVLEEFTVRQFDFFIDVHKPRNRREIHKAKDLDKLATDIFWCAKNMFETVELIEFCEKLRHIIDRDTDKKGKTLGINLSMVNFLDGVRQLKDFYEFHQDRGGAVKDRRVEYLIKLRFRVKSMIRFMQKRI